METNRFALPAFYPRLFALLRNSRIRNYTINRTLVKLDSMISYIFSVLLQWRLAVRFALKRAPLIDAGGFVGKGDKVCPVCADGIFKQAVDSA